MIINLELENYIDCHENIGIVADCYIETSTDLICVDTGYEETTMDVEIEELLIDNVVFSTDNLLQLYGQDIADKITEDIYEKIGQKL
jgi:hypothetical protein